MKKVTRQEFIDFIIKYEGYFLDPDKKIIEDLCITSYFGCITSYKYEDSMYSYEVRDLIGKIIKRTEKTYTGCCWKKEKINVIEDYYINDNALTTVEAHVKNLNDTFKKKKAPKKETGKRAKKTP